MGFAVETVAGEDLASNAGNRLQHPGWFHATIVDVKDGLSTQGKSINGFTVEVDIMAGKADEANVDPKEIAGKTMSLTFFAPDLSGSAEQQDGTRRLNTAFLVAANLIDPSKLGQAVEIDPLAAIRHHIVIHLRWKHQNVDVNGVETWVDDKQYMQIAYADVCHIDDPQAASIPKNVAALKFIKPEHRHKPEWFAFKAKNGNGAAPAAAKAPAGNVDVDV